MEVFIMMREHKIYYQSDNKKVKQISINKISAS